MLERTLHPNLAKIAAAYDEIVERANRNALTAPAARDLIAQLEARDDEGVRWSIDASTGAWIRKTAFGDLEFDSAPPTSGYATPDAFDLTPNATAFNPGERLTFQQVSNAAPYPGALLGATRRETAGPARMPGPNPRRRTRRMWLAGILLLVLGTAVTAAALNDSPDIPPAVLEHPAP